MQTEHKSPKAPAGPNVVLSPAPRLVAAGTGSSSTRSVLQIAYKHGESLYLSSIPLGEVCIPCGPAAHEEDSAEHAANTSPRTVATDSGGADCSMLSSLQLRLPVNEKTCGQTSDAVSSNPGLKPSLQWLLATSLPAPPARHSINQWVHSGTRVYALMESADSSAAQHHLICSTEIGSSDQWESIHPPVTPDPATQAISHLAILDTNLYLTLDDEILGFQLWRCTIARGNPGDWEKIMDQGGYQHAANAHVTAIHATDDQLLIACAGNAHLTQLKERPVAAELIMVNRDDSWALLVGTTRMTPQGLLVPRAARGRGFDTAGGSTITSITRYGAVFLVAMRSLDNDGEQLNGQVWSSEDLRTWTELELPAELGGQNGNLVAALQTTLATIYLIERKLSPIADSCEKPGAHAGANLDVQVLPGGMEIWLNESVN